MTHHDPLLVFESLATQANDDPPRMHVASHVMRRIRRAQTTSERTLAWLAAGSCVAAIMAVAVGYSLLVQFADPLEAIFQIVPPIEL